MRQRAYRGPVVFLAAMLVRLMLITGSQPFAVAASPGTHTSRAENAVRYTVTDLGPIHPHAINNRGQVVGQESGHWMHAGPILWDAGEVIHLSPTAGSAYDINDAGQVVGSSLNPATEWYEAFLWEDANGNGQSDPGELQWLGTLGGVNDFNGSAANGINNLGHVVGEACCEWNENGSVTYAVRWQNGGMVSLGTLGGDSSTAYAINDHDQIVGWSQVEGDDAGHAFLWQDGRMSDLGADYYQSRARAINNAGQVVGFIDWPDNFPFLWLPEPAYGLPAGLNTLDLPGNQFGINNLGHLVDGPILWKNGVTTNINTLFPADSGWSVANAADINDRGQITGRANYNGEGRGFLLTPVAPLIFVPGISASELVDSADSTERWPGLFHSQAPLSLLPGDAPFANIIAPDVLRRINLPVGSDIHVYDLLLNELTSRDGYVEYEVAGMPARRTGAGCDVDGQAANNPNLFVFAYDWRLDNISNAAALKEYVGCVQQFYPDTPVNILAHSMGGLLARRYILDNPDDHDVETLISIGSPFLGAPKMIYVLESGDFVPFVSNSRVRTIVASFTAAHQLLPGEPYYILAGNSPGTSPLIEAGWDLNENGQAEEGYSYGGYIQALDDRYARHPFAPGATAHSFHAYGTAHGGQDDWRNDTTGVQYHHIVGQQAAPKTVGQVRAALETICIQQLEPQFGLNCHVEEVFKLAFTTGDGTVPVLSAARQGNGLDYNAPDAQVHIVTNADAQLVEHTGLTHNPEVWQLVRDLLVGANAPDAAPDMLPVAATAGVEAEAYYYLRISGGAQVSVKDASGNSTAPIDGTLNGRGTVPGVDSYELSDWASLVVMSPGQPYEVIFQADEGLLAVELLVGSGPNIRQAVRYQDVTLPAGVAVQLTFDAHGYEEMRYDSDGDGIYETTVTPTVSLSGSQAEDVEAPRIAFRADAEQDGWRVTLSAEDKGSGVKGLHYSLDGATFQPYTDPFTIARQSALLYVFADDHAANRSTRIINLAPHRLYLPVVVR
jgi:probable HAF family extracellular repeat protein